jgi:hypothetical protein
MILLHNGISGMAILDATECYEYHVGTPSDAGVPTSLAIWSNTL